MHTKNLPAIQLIGFFCLMIFSLSLADEVKLKTGVTLTGRITYEADDIIKIEVPISESIKETKIISRGDIAEIIKEAPDSVAFNGVQKLVPTGSLMPASAYRQILETGPDAFLKAFPTSVHAPKVKEIRATLAEELDKVERGSIKLDGEWISPQEKIDFKDLVESRIRLLKMESFAKSGNYNGLISAMKEFEILEKTTFGSPAFPKAVELAKQVIPDLGRQLQNMLRDVDYRNAEFERSLAASTPDAQAQLKAARTREEKAYQDSVAADKKAGIKWVQLNPRVKTSIEAYLKLAGTELARIRAFDTATLAAQAEKLVEVDKLIAQNDLAAARAKLAEAAAMTGQKTDSKSKSKSSGKSGSYIAILSAKINERLSDEKARETAKKAASESEALTANLKKSETVTTEGTPPAPVTTTEETEGAPAAPAEAAAPATEVDEFAALAGSKKGTPKQSEKTKPGSKKSKAKTTDEASDGEDDEEVKKERPPVIEEEGGFPFGLVVPIITALLILTVVLLKVFGIGGKKTEE